MESVNRRFSSLSSSSAVRYSDLGTKPPSGMSHLRIKNKRYIQHTSLALEENQPIQVGVTETAPHHALPSQEVRDDFFVNVVHQSSCALVVVSSINEELLTRVLINQVADLDSGVVSEHESDKVRPLIFDLFRLNK